MSDTEFYLRMAFAFGPIFVLGVVGIVLLIWWEP